ncbi:MAG TPA: 3'-5' exonuclease [Nostocaceae cyanobacterium]|nr:3'-5' exonuclease [Nostocaceae cyanobacterium]
MTIKLLIIDTETCDETHCCEIAATLYQVSPNLRECGAIASCSTILPINDENSYEWLNGITPELSLKARDSLVTGFHVMLAQIIAESDYCLAFNAEFDETVIHRAYPRQKFPPFICAMQDLDWGYPGRKKNGTFKLVDLALWLGIGVGTAHRAGDDVRLLVECLDRKKPYLYEMFEIAIALIKSPKIKVKALVRYEERHLASEAGFYAKYIEGKFSHWEKEIRECHLAELRESVDFQVVVLELPVGV